MEEIPVEKWEQQDWVKVLYLGDGKTYIGKVESVVHTGTCTPNEHGTPNEQNNV